jgi:hypothetical protein
MGRSAAFGLLAALIATLLFLPVIPAFGRSPMTMILQEAVFGFLYVALPIGIFAGVLFNAILLRPKWAGDGYRVIAIPSIITSLSITMLLAAFLIRPWAPSVDGVLMIFTFFTLSTVIITLTAYLLKQIARGHKTLPVSIVMTALIAWGLAGQTVLDSLFLGSSPSESTQDVKPNSN